MLGALAGCSLLVDTGGLSESASPDAAVDGAAPPGVPPPGSPPGVPPPPPPPGSGDGGVETGTPFVCDAAFCDDFDDGGFGAKWSKTTIVGATVTFGLEDAGVSPPNALLLDMALRTATTSRRGYLTRDVPFGSARCDFDMSIDEAGASTDDLGLFAISVATTDSYELELKSGAGRLFVYETFKLVDAAVNEKKLDVAGRPLAGFHHVSFATDWTTLTITIDGALVQLGLRGGVTGATTMSYLLGETGDGDLSHFAVRYDNVACTPGP